MFTTFNQFTAAKNNMELASFSNSCNACPIFVLITVHEFMNNGTIDQKQHENNLTMAIKNYITNSYLPKYMSFNELIQFTGEVFTDNSILASTPEIINEYGYDSIFDPSIAEQNHAIIFLKNSNYIVVLVKFIDGNKTYHIRDCHEKNQYDFDTLDALTEHLSNVYQFNQLTVVDGVLIEEYSNIEYLILNKQFPITGLNTPFNNIMEIKNNEEKSDDEMLLNLDAFSIQELKDMGIPNDLTSSDLTSSDLTPNDLTSNDLTSNDLTSNDQLSLDEIMAIQLQFGETNFND
jgi:uncharacterized protein YkuJ